MRRRGREWQAGLLRARRGVRRFFLDQLIPNWRDFLARRTPLVWLLALFTGLIVGYAAVGFLWLIGQFQLLWLGTDGENVSATARTLPWAVVLLAPAVGGLLVGLILQFFMPGRRAHSVADVIEAQALREAHLSPRVGLLSALVTTLSLGFGASAGREGPVVHLGATLAVWAQSAFQLPRAARRTLLASGAAAAVAASFNAPIAGVLFAHEVILAHYGLSALVPVIIASVVATALARGYLGDAPAFTLPDYLGSYQIASYWEFPAFVLLGITCALVAILFQLALVGTDHAARRIRMPLWLRPVLGGLLVGALALIWPEVLGVGYDATDAALKQQLPLALMFALILAKTAATAITLASRFGGGVFSPSLYLGAMTGGVFGMMAAMVFPEVASSSGFYAILGMGAVSAAVLGAPLSTALIVFELTGNYDMTLALLLVVAIATGLTLSVHGVSYFHWQLNMRGLYLQSGPHTHVMRRLKVRDFMRPRAADEKAGADRALDESGGFRLSPDDTVRTALRTFDRAGRSRLPVTDPSAPERLLAWAHHVDALNRLNHALIEAHEEEHR